MIETKEKLKKLTNKQANFGIGFHTSLRKFCDSDATSICHNIISLMNEYDWQEFIIFMTDKEINKENCLKSIPLGKSDILNIFHIGLRMMNDNEYKNINKLVNEE